MKTLREFVFQQDISDFVEDTLAWYFGP